MIAVDEELLICDFAETYHIYDYRSLPARRAATFAVGLRDDSRIKMKLAGMNVSKDSMMTAAIADRLGQLVWGLSGGEGAPPASFVDVLCDIDRPVKDNSDIVTFESAEAFEAARKNLMKEG